jgi:hypothetical protein
MHAFGMFLVCMSTPHVLQGVISMMTVVLRARLLALLAVHPLYVLLVSCLSAL